MIKFSVKLCKILSLHSLNTKNKECFVLKILIEVRNHE